MLLSVSSPRTFLAFPVLPRLSAETIPRLSQSHLGMFLLRILKPTKYEKVPKHVILTYRYHIMQYLMDIEVEILKVFPHFAANIDCEFSLELPHQGTYNHIL